MLNRLWDSIEMNLIERETVRVFVMCWYFIKWPIRENELVTDTVTLGRKNAIDDAEFLKWDYLFLFQLLYQLQRAVNRWCGYPTTFIHTFIGPGILVYSIVLLHKKSFQYRMKYYAEYIRFIFQFSYFTFPISSSILFIYSYCHTILLLFSKITFICDDNYSNVSIMLLGNGCWFYPFATYMCFLYISLTITIRQEL